MNNLKRKSLLVVLWCSFLQIQTLQGVMPASVEITSDKTTIQIGEPLLLKLIYKFKEPYKDTETGKPHSTIRHESFLLLELKESDKSWLSSYPDFKPFRPEGKEVEYYPLQQLEPSQLTVQDNQGLEYGDYFPILYHRYRRGAIFDKAGTYKIYVLGFGKLFSNAMDIEVTSGPTQNVFSDPNDYVFLMGERGGMFKKNNAYRSKVKSRLKSLVDQSSQTLLAKWAAARLGLEYYEEEELEKVKTRREKKEVRKDIFVKTVKYLSIATKLPDDFPLRREVLYRLAEIEAEAEIESGRNNFTKALQYYDELIAKYPQSRYGESAASHKEEVLKFQKKKRK
jgi:hypothetical protein